MLLQLLPLLFSVLLSSGGSRSTTTNTVHAQQQEQKKYSEYCRDRNGYDCEDRDVLLRMYYNSYHDDPLASETLPTLEQSDYEYLCCKVNGGERVTSRGRAIQQIENVTKNSNFDQELFQHQGSPQHRALFFIAIDDEYVSSISYRTQRYALAVLYFHLGGAKLWKTCWSGSRYYYDDGNYQNVYSFRSHYGYLYSNSTCDNDDDGKKAWLSPVHECDWAFVECDRNNFVTGISMVANVKKESYNVVPYVLTTYDVMSLPHEISLLDRLTKLDLRDNFLTGTIPTTIGELRKLRMLNLYGNRITGSIPKELYSIGGLEYLVLGRNSLNGTISTGIAQLTHLRSLYLGYKDNIGGSIPSQMMRLSYLGELY